MLFRSSASASESTEVEDVVVSAVDGEFMSAIRAVGFHHCRGTGWGLVVLFLSSHVAPGGPRGCAYVT